MSNEAPQHPVRKSPRLKDYDYALDGMYFLTICTQKRLTCLAASHTIPCIQRGGRDGCALVAGNRKNILTSNWTSSS